MLIWYTFDQNSTTPQHLQIQLKKFCTNIVPKSLSEKAGVTGNYVAYIRILNFYAWNFVLVPSVGSRSAIKRILTTYHTNCTLYIWSKIIISGWLIFLLFSYNFTHNSLSFRHTPIAPTGVCHAVLHADGPPAVPHRFLQLFSLLPPIFRCGLESKTTLWSL